MEMTMTMAAQTCGQCAHSYEEKQGDIVKLFCRCDPPKCWPMMRPKKLDPNSPEVFFISAFPPCPEDGLGCGQFEPRIGGPL